MSSLAKFGAANEVQQTCRIIRIKEVINRTGLSRGGIYARIKRQEFPPSVALGGRAVGWPESDIDDWVTSCISASREVEAR